MVGYKSMAAEDNIVLEMYGAQSTENWILRLQEAFKLGHISKTKMDNFIM